VVGALGAENEKGETPRSASGFGVWEPPNEKGAVEVGVGGAPLPKVNGEPGGFSVVDLSPNTFAAAELGAPKLNGDGAPVEEASGF
jgi:hypothetical protein